MTFYMGDTRKIFIILIAFFSLSCYAVTKVERLNEEQTDTLDIAKARCFNDILVFDVDSSCFFRNAGNPDTLVKNGGGIFDKENRKLIKYDLLEYGDYRFALFNGRIGLISVIFDNPNTLITTDKYSLNSKFTLKDAAVAFPHSYKEKTKHPVFAKEISEEFSSIDDSRWNCIYLDDAHGGLIQLYFVDKKLQVALFDFPKL
ncbi:MAG: hypothetical protein JW783_07050 [Bacteroidales bacterium]|nr:hypothetical protein [Bacteroidales bacterium]MBN2748318.1 hypothetical protein [Bacteroidales bacterium]